MMNEQKIIELLAEYLRKTDRLIERWDRQELVWANKEEHRAKLDQRLDVAYQVLIAHSEKMEKLEAESAELRKESAELRKESNLLQHQMKKIEIRTDATWKKFLAVTKSIGIPKRKR